MIRGADVDESAMTCTDLEGYTVTTVSVPVSRANGLWAALASHVSQRSAGSRLVNPSGVGQPVSALRIGGRRDMFSYDDSRCHELEPLPAA